MKTLVLAAATAITLALASAAAAALVPWTFVGPGAICSPTSTFNAGVLHLSKPCTSDTNASAGATITGVNGQTFTSASFTLANAGQCQGGSPRFNISTTGGLFFLGCNNVTPTISNGMATYTFSPANLVPQLPGNTVGTITGVDILIDQQGTADISNIMVNGQSEVPVTGGPTSKDQCKHGGWKSFSSPSFRNQGQCVSWFEHNVLHHGHGHANGNDNGQGHGQGHDEGQDDD